MAHIQNMSAYYISIMYIFFYESTRIKNKYDITLNNFSFLFVISI